MFIYFFEVSIADYVTTRARERETDFFFEYNKQRNEQHLLRQENIFYKFKQFYFYSETTLKFAAKNAARLFHKQWQEKRKSFLYWKK